MKALLSLMLIMSALGGSRAHAGNFFDFLFQGDGRNDTGEYTTDSGDAVWPKLTPRPEPDIYFDPAILKNENFDVVILVNKAISAQTITVYLFGKLEFQSRVSTGRETPEYANGPGRGKFREHAPKDDYFSQTPTGYYTAGTLDIDHKSGDWNDALMAHSIFLRGTRGIALHRTVNEDAMGRPFDKHIGHRASGGCIRLHAEIARKLFWMVRASGGPLRDDVPASAGNGGADYNETSNSLFMSEAKQQLGPDGIATYTEIPRVYDVDRYTGEVLSTYHYGMKTLIVVENIPVTGTVESNQVAAINNNNPLYGGTELSQTPAGLAPKKKKKSIFKDLKNFFGG